MRRLAGLSLLFLGLSCSRSQEPGNPSVEQLLAAYASGNATAQAEARKTIVAYSDRALPDLKKALSGKLATVAARAIVDIGTDGAYQVLVEFVGGSTGPDATLACTYTRAFIEKNALPLSRARSLGDAENVAVRALAEGRVNSIVGIRLVQALETPAGDPVLRSLAATGDFQVRWEAAGALYQRTGERAPVAMAMEQFPAQAEPRQVVRKLSQLAAPEPEATDCTVWREGQDFGYLIASASRERTEVQVHRGAAESVRFELPGYARDPVVFALTAEAIGLAALCRGTDGTSSVWAVSLSGDKAWGLGSETRRYTAIAGAFSGGLHASGLIASFQDGSRSGVELIDAEGKTSTEQDLRCDNVGTSACSSATAGCADQVQCCHLGTQGVPFNQIPLALPGGDIRTALPWRVDSGECLYAVTVSLDTGQPGLALVTRDRVKAQCLLPGRVVGMARATDRCENDGVLVVLCQTGDLLALTADLAPLWRERIAEPTAAFYEKAGVGQVPGSIKEFFTFCGGELAVWSFCQ